MSDLRKAAEMALWALRYINQYSLAPHNISLPGEIDTAVDALRAALAQPEQLVVGGADLPTLTKWTPQRKPLTDEEIDAACGSCDDSDLARGFRREFIKRFRVIYERLHGIGGEE